MVQLKVIKDYYVMRVMADGARFLEKEDNQRLKGKDRKERTSLLGSAVSNVM